MNIKAKIRFQDLPEKFDEVLVVGSLMSAFAVSRGVVFSLLMDPLGDTIATIGASTSSDEYKLVDEARVPHSQKFGEMSREELRTALGERAYLFAPLYNLGIAMNAKAEKEIRSVSLTIAEALLQGPPLTFTRALLLNSVIPDTADIKGVRLMCQHKGLRRIKNLLDEMDELKPFVPQVNSRLESSFLPHITETQWAQLLEKGLFVEAARGMKRQDYRKLDFFVEGLIKTDPLVQEIPQGAALLRSVPRLLRCTGTMTAANAPKYLM